MGCITPIEAFLQPPISLLAKVPQTAALAVYFVFFGTGMEMYVAMIAFGIIPALAVTVHLAIKDLPSEMLDKAYTLGASHFEVASGSGLEADPAQVHRRGAPGHRAGDRVSHRCRDGGGRRRFRLPDSPYNSSSPT